MDRLLPFVPADLPERPYVKMIREGRVLAEGAPAAVQANRQVLEAYLGN